MGPGYDVVAQKREDVGLYDVIDHNPKEANKSPVNPTSDEAEKKGDDFYDAEEHTYSVVNVKNKKKSKKVALEISR